MTVAWHEEPEQRLGYEFSVPPGPLDMGEIYVPRAVEAVQPPNKSVVAEAWPKYEWGPIAEATHYSLQVNEVGGDVVEYVGGLTTNTHKSGVELKDGMEYRWAIEALQSGICVGRTAGDGFRFTVRLE